ncbi:MAG: citryl-CoA lyase [Candidatus Portnoybacteria bacterium]|nr:citryl-CoA lyase [Candidatus Portnoybacteria bacterium]
MKWRTSISTHKNGDLYVRGKALGELIETRSFSEVAFLLLKGTLPTEKENKLFNAMLVSMSEHGIAAPSTFIARTAISTGNTFNSAIAAGILSIGEYHGGAVEKCAYLLQVNKSAEYLVDNVLKRGGRMPGYGHRLYKEKDPRAEVLVTKAKKLGLSGNYVKLAMAIEKELQKKTGKKLPLNIDGAVAALMLELGFDWRLGKALFVLGRLPGLIAHTHEELVREKPYRRLDETDIEYDGP